MLDEIEERVVDVPHGLAVGFFRPRHGRIEASEVNDAYAALDLDFHARAIRFEHVHRALAIRVTFAVDDSKSEIAPEKIEIAQRVRRHRTGKTDWNERAKCTACAKPTR